MAVGVGSCSGCPAVRLSQRASDCRKELARARRFPLGDAGKDAGDTGFGDGQRPLIGPSGTNEVPLGPEQHRQVVQAWGVEEVALPKRFLVDGQGPLQQGPGGGEVPLIPE